MTGQMMERYEREVEDFRFLPIRHSLADNAIRTRPSASRTTSESNEGRHKLRVAIGISGSLTNEEDMILPWSILDKTSVETFALRWEVAALLRLGVSLSSVLKSYAWQYAKWELARRTLFSAVAAGLWPLGLLKMAKIVDNPFSVARARADKAGKVLADALIEKCQGERPVTLIGYSVGARVIYSCLLELADRKAFGLIENVVLMGAPTPSDSEPWTKLRSVVSGRVVNCYSTEDYILGFLYRASSGQFEVAGLQMIEGVNGVENFDFSPQVSGHTRYRYMIGQILQQIDFEDVDPSEVEREYAILKALDRDEQKLEGRKPQAPAYDEAARIEERIRERVGSPAQNASAAVDQAEEKRRQELLLAAEACEASNQEGSPPAYEDIPSKSASSFSTSAATRRPDVSTLRSPVVHADATPDAHHLQDKTTSLHITDKEDAVDDVDDAQSVASEVDSVRSGPLEMMHVAPIPEDDDDPYSSTR
jgi:pimeloyl-ACP methyl ester carboxylesterase